MAESMPSDRFSQLIVGQSASITRTVSETDVLMFAASTGDLNPVHLDHAYASTTRFGGRIAHGMLTAGYVSAALAMHLPGPGSVYLSQSVRFVRPVRIGDTILTHVEVVELFPLKRRVRLATTCRNAANEVVLDGEAMVLLPKEG